MRSHLRQLTYLCLAVLFVCAVGTRESAAQTVARCGEGWLELIDGYPVLHLKGSHYEMGYQQGALLKESIRRNMHNMLVAKADEEVEVGPVKVRIRTMIDSITTIQKKFVPQKYYDEMDGLAAGADLKPQDVVAANFIPELFHCSGFALMNSATKDGTLYHGRVLDYAIDWGLQEHAVVIVAEPEGGHPFVNIAYSGFIGSVTGMNAKSVSVGEMGGKGLGHWAGVPMALLVREVLERAGDLDEAIAIFRDSPRTCQYFYVVADGKTNRAVGMEASWDTFTLIQPGESNPLLPTPVKDTALLSAGDRYKELVRRTQAGYGQFDADSARRLMDCPVAMKSNLHNVLFAPQSTKFWVANASVDKKPAADQKYYAFQLTELVRRSPEMTAPAIPLVAKTARAESGAATK
ncbi:MAG TPA: C45 family peptidase [Planctomycetaceae bacterium]|nr:C45 family peptidase [Planctomycetaceae bacterium]